MDRIRKVFSCGKILDVCLVLEIKDPLLWKYPVFVPALFSGRAVEEQLCELTRLVLRLPEVDSLLQRAGVQPTATRLEPNSVLEMFVKVTHVYRSQIHCGLMLSTKVNLCIWKCYSKLVLGLLLGYTTRDL